MNEWSDYKFLIHQARRSVRFIEGGLATLPDDRVTNLHENFIRGHKQSGKMNESMLSILIHNRDAD